LFYFFAVCASKLLYCCHRVTTLIWCKHSTSSYTCNCYRVNYVRTIIKSSYSSVPLKNSWRLLSHYLNFCCLWNHFRLFKVKLEPTESSSYFYSSSPSAHCSRDRLAAVGHPRSWPFRSARQQGTQMLPLALSCCHRTPSSLRASVANRSPLASRPSKPVDAAIPLLPGSPIRKQAATKHHESLPFPNQRSSSSHYCLGKPLVSCLRTLFENLENSLRSSSLTCQKPIKALWWCILKTIYTYDVYLALSFVKLLWLFREFFLCFRDQDSRAHYIPPCYVSMRS